MCSMKGKRKTAKKVPPDFIYIFLKDDAILEAMQKKTR